MQGLAARLNLKRSVRRLNRQGAGGESPLRGRISEPHRPRAVRQQWRSVGRGVHRPAIEPRKIVVLGADTVAAVEGNMYGRDSASGRTTRRGQRPWHVQTLLVSGNRESSRSSAGSKAAGPRQEGEEP